jgi:hypothetical protein
MSVRRFRADKIKYPVYTGTTIAKDDLVAINANGYAIPATDTAGLRFVGVCAKGVVNAGASGAIEVEVHRTGVISMAATSIAVTQLGDTMYVVDKNTFDETSNNSIACGILVKRISNTVGWLYFGPGGISKPVSANGGYTTSRETNVAGLSSAITLCTEIRLDMIAHFANATRHTTGQQSSAAFGAVPTTLATLLATAGTLLTAFAAHNADAILGSGWAYHTAQAADKVLTSAVTPATLQQAITRLVDLKAKYNDHEDETTGHAGQASVTANQVAAADADYGAAILVPDSKIQADDLIYWTILDNGTGNVTGVSAVASEGGITFTFSADPQNDSIISYEAIRL